MVIGDPSIFLARAELLASPGHTKLALLLHAHKNICSETSICTRRHTRTRTHARTHAHTRTRVHTQNNTQRRTASRSLGSSKRGGNTCSAMGSSRGMEVGLDMAAGLGTWRHFLARLVQRISLTGNILRGAELCMKLLGSNFQGQQSLVRAQAGPRQSTGPQQQLLQNKKRTKHFAAIDAATKTVWKCEVGTTTHRKKTVLLRAKGAGKIFDVLRS